MTIKRAYTILTVKSFDDSSDERIIEGIASTPTADRVGDVVEPLGAKFKLPMPLLWQHQHDQPVGLVEFAEPTKSGIPFRARLPKNLEPGKLRERVEEAWQSVKAGLVSAVSIGFNALEYDIMSTGGVRFKSWEWLELSLVTIPANSEATIQTVKSLDQQALSRAASGKKEKGSMVVKLQAAGASATQNPKPKSNSESTTMTLKEQLEALRAKRAASATRMTELLGKSAEAGETLNAAEQEEFDTLEGEIEAIDGQIKRMETAERLNASSAKPVDGKSVAAASASRGGNLQLRKPEEKGLGFAKYARCIALAKGNIMQAEHIAKTQYADDQRIQNIIKAAVSAGSTTDPTWVGALVGDESSVFSDFVEFLRPRTVLGQFGAGGVPSLRQVPFRVPLLGQTSGGAGYWVGEGKGKPLTKFDFTRTTLEPHKVANIAVLTQEAIRYSNPSADVLVRDALADALRERIDQSFVNPLNVGLAGVSPASITNGVTPIVSSGNTADAVRADLRALFATYIAANNAPTSAVLIMSSLTALSLSLLTNAMGQLEFPNVSMTGGTLNNIPVIVSDYMVADSTGYNVIMVNAQDIWIGDEGGVAIDMSSEASLEMVDNPTQDSVVGTGASLVSMFQTNSVAIRAERTISWAKRRASAVAYLRGVNWGATA